MYDYSLENRVVNSLYNAALDYYGELQVDVAVEEMSELTKALIKNRRCQYVLDFIGADLLDAMRHDIVEELADVQVMIDQLRLKYCSEAEFAVAVKEKQSRLLRRLTEQGVRVDA